MLLVQDIPVACAKETASLLIETWHDTYTGLMPQARLDGLNLPSITQQWQKILVLPREDAHIVGAFHEQGHLLGFCGGGAPREEQDFEVELYALNVPKRFQKLGVGRRLFQESVQRFLAQGSRDMYLWVVDGNQNAIDFYLHMGGSKSDLRKQGEGYQELLMYWPDLRKVPT